MVFKAKNPADEMSETEKENFVGIKKDDAPYIGVYLKDKEEDKKDPTLAATIANGVGLGVAGALVGGGLAAIKKGQLANRLQKIANKTTLKNYLSNEMGQDFLEGMMSSGTSGYAEYASNAREIARHKLKDQQIINIARGREWLNGGKDVLKQLGLFSNSQQIQKQGTKWLQQVEDMMARRRAFSNSEAVDEVLDEETDEENLTTKDGEPVRLPSVAAGTLAAGVGLGIAVPSIMKINQALLTEYKDKLDKIIHEASKNNYVSRQFLPFAELHHNNVIHRLAKLPKVV